MIRIPVLINTLFSRASSRRAQEGKPALSPDCLRAPLRVSDVCIEALRPVIESGTGLTKAGRLSLRGRVGAQAVKVYSCFSSDQVRLRLAVQQCAFRGLRFPEIVAHEGHIVVERWIDGDAVTETKAPEVCDAVATFLLECADDERSRGLVSRYGAAFCYVDFLFQRIEPWLGIDAIRAVAAAARNALEATPAAFPDRLTHPDLSAANLVVELGSQAVYVVDNELLGVGKGWIIDYHNSLLARRGAPDPRMPGAPERFLAERLWRLRRLGSALHAGDFQRANTVLGESPA